MRHGKKLLARSLEVNLTTHCNLSCYGCDHASPVNSEGYLSVEELVQDLAALSEVYHVFEFRLTGGEPLLHPRLLEVIDAIRDSGVAEKIMLVTNGVLLHNAPAGLWERIDKLWVSIYPGVKRKLSHEDVRALATRHGLLAWYKPIDHFSMKLLHSENRDPDLIRTVYSTCTNRASCHTLHNGRYFKCSSSPFIPDWLRRVGSGSPDFSGGSVPVRNNPDLRRQLEQYLRNEQPLIACSYCLGCAGRTTASRQMNKPAMQAWLAEKDPDVREMIDWKYITQTKALVDSGEDLTGLLPTLVWRKLRWSITLWLKRLARIDLVGLPQTMVRATIRRLLSPWLSGKASVR